MTRAQLKQDLANKAARLARARLTGRDVAGAARAHENAKRALAKHRADGAAKAMQDNEVHVMVRRPLRAAHWSGKRI